MRKRECIFWLAVGAALLLLFIGIIPTHYQICETNQYTEKEHCASHQVLPFLFLQIGKLLDAGGVAVTALFTGVLAIFTARLWISTEKLWGETRDAGERQTNDTRILQRAYIAVEPRGINLLVEGKRVIGHIGIKNAGNLPAANLSWFIALKTSDNGLEKSFPLEETAGKIIIAPRVVATRGSDSSLNIHDLDKIANSQDRSNRAKENPLFLYVWGEIRYDDGFKPRRITKFCHRYNWKARGLGAANNHEISGEYARYHEYGNDAT